MHMLVIGWAMGFASGFVVSLFSLDNLKEAHRKDREHWTSIMELKPEEKNDLWEHEYWKREREKDDEEL
jgi:hypothetical protein